ncbi:MAG: ATP-binding cassette domain-containing protein [Erysipelotrichaceae bacterium]
MNIIEINGLRKYYGKQKGVEDVSFVVEEGEIFGFIGPNGAGKSTTIRSMLGLIKPQKGTILVFGKDIETHLEEILSDVGYLPSEVYYYDHMRVKDLLAYSASFYHKDCSKRIQELATLLDLDLNRKIDDLSYGNKKKVGIIQGLLHEPKLIILDEPTGGLDPLMQHRFFSLLKEEQKRGATILFSSHILSEVQKICDRVAIIKDGSLVRVDRVNEMQENSYLKVMLRIKEEQELATFQGMRNKTQENGVISFFYEGDIRSLLTNLLEVELQTIQIQEPTLEEIFLHYYTNEEL